MKWGTKIIVGLAAALPLCHQAFAEGLYLNAGVGQSRVNGSLQQDLDAVIASPSYPNVVSSLSNDTLATGGLGYFFNDRFAIEGNYINSGSLVYTGTSFKTLNAASGTNTGTQISVRTRVTGYQVAAVGMLPLSKTFSVFGKIGYLTGTSKADASAFAAASENNSSFGFGVGAAVKLSEQLSIRGGWDRYSQDLSGISLSTQLHF